MLLYYYDITTLLYYYSTVLREGLSSCQVQGELAKEVVQNSEKPEKPRRPREAAGGDHMTVVVDSHSNISSKCNMVTVI